MSSLYIVISSATYRITMQTWGQGGRRCPEEQERVGPRCGLPSEAGGRSADVLAAQHTADQAQLTALRVRQLALLPRGK